MEDPQGDWTAGAGGTLERAWLSGVSNAAVGCYEAMIHSAPFCTGSPMLKSKLQSGSTMTQTHDGQDTFNRDTEFRDEEHHLEVVVGSIDAMIRYREGRGPALAGDRKATNKVQELIDAGLEKTRSVRNRPYFGRVDYAGSDGEEQRIYIGDINMQHDDPQYLVVSRNAPIAKLYYVPTDGFYETLPDAKSHRPRQRHDALVHLKRTLTIKDARLLDFDDVLGLPPGPAALQSTSSRTLDEKLSDTGGDQLLDAAQTIQPEQYEQIAATQKPVLIVQGAAGSGKSLIGLHRIDFISVAVQ